MDDNLIQAIRIIEGIKTNPDNFYNAHLFTTENISGFTKKLPFENKVVLTVCSSGDQAFNMIFNGALEVDLFDANMFTKYYFYLKEAAIKCLSYKQFLDFFTYKNKFNSNVFSFDTYLEIRTNINDEEIRKFWDYLFCHYSGKTIYNSNIFVNSDDRKAAIERNDYLKSESNYNELKKQFKDRKFNFYNINLFDESIPSDKKYDFVYLSNIFDYLNISDKLKYLKKIKDIILKIKNNLTIDGVIAVSYLYFYFDDCLSVESTNNLNSFQVRNELASEFYYVVFPGVSAPLSRQLRNKDALMLYKNN